MITKELLEDKTGPIHSFEAGGIPRKVGVIQKIYIVILESGVQLFISQFPPSLSLPKETQNIVTIVQVDDKRDPVLIPTITDETVEGLLEKISITLKNKK